MFFVNYMHLHIMEEMRIMKIGNNPQYVRAD